MDLLAKGDAPSITDIAAVADVSRRTIYMYFPTVEQLLTDAALGLATESAMAQVLDPSTFPGDAAARIEALARSVQKMSADTEHLGRTILRLTIEQKEDGLAPRRGYRRIEWIETAIDSLRGKVDKASFERLVSALAMVIGWEAMLVQKDVRRLEPADAEEVSVWAARALVNAALQE
jgi:AcrR family transcriptional regulator